MSINQSVTTAYHPQSNGMVERFHRVLKNSLRAKLSGANWVRDLPWVLLGIRSTPRDDCAVSPAEMTFGTNLQLPGDVTKGDDPPPVEIFTKDLKERMAKLEPPAPTHNTVPKF